MSEEEHSLLVEVGNDFWNELGQSVAKALNRMPPELHGITLAYLQDKCSVYGSPFPKFIFPTTGDTTKP